MNDTRIACIVIPSNTGGDLPHLRHPMGRITQPVFSKTIPSGGHARQIRWLKKTISPRCVHRFVFACDLHSREDQCSDLSQGGGGECYLVILLHVWYDKSYHTCGAGSLVARVVRVLLSQVSSGQSYHTCFTGNFITSVVRVILSHAWHG